MPSTARPIAVLLEGLDDAHAAVVGGLKRYRDQHRLDWSVQIVGPGDITAMPPDSAWVLRTAGLVEQVLQQAAVPALPVCTLLGAEGAENRTCCRLDEELFGTLAAEHLAERGYRQVATVDIGPRERFERRRAGFAAAARGAGLVYEHRVRPQRGDAAASDATLVAWVRAQPNPVGFYAVIDAQGTWLRDLFAAHGLAMPEEVAVLGTGDHTATCLRREPELSSVAYPWGLMGQAAGHHLHHQLQGAGAPPAQDLRPYRVVARASTRAAPVGDPVVERAIRWLGRHLAEPRPLAALVGVTGLSDPTLCRRFKRACGQSPKQVQDRLRIERACELLADPWLGIAEVARRSGFRSTTALGVAFRRRRGCSPSHWRAAVG